jgi:hypothetical protein
VAMVYHADTLSLLVRSISLIVRQWRGTHLHVKGLASVTCFAGLLHLIPIFCLIASSFKICQHLAYLER